MKKSFLHIQQSLSLEGSVTVSGSKNASMVILLSSLLTNGVSLFHNIPAISDVFQIGEMLKALGATFVFDTTTNSVEIDTTHVQPITLPTALMKTTRASILVLGPLLARFGTAHIGLPGGDAIGSRPLDLHLSNLEKMGTICTLQDGYLSAAAHTLTGRRLTLAYPSVGATENIMMAAVKATGRTTIINAAIEPEVLDLVGVLRSMGALITIEAPATIIIDGVNTLQPTTYTIIPDRLEAGALLIAGAMTGGDIYLPNITHTLLDVPLLKLQEMGHTIAYAENHMGIRLIGTKSPTATSFKTGPYPNFPTDLQAPMMAALACARGQSIIEETVFENRLQHTHPLTQLGATIEIIHTNKAKIDGVTQLYGIQVGAHDIRAVCCLVLAGLVAQGTTVVDGVHHWQRGFEGLEQKLCALGGNVKINLQ